MDIDAEMAIKNDDGTETYVTLKFKTASVARSFAQVAHKASNVTGIALKGLDTGYEVMTFVSMKEWEAIKAARKSIVSL